MQNTVWLIKDPCQYRSTLRRFFLLIIGWASVVVPSFAHQSHVTEASLTIYENGQFDLKVVAEISKFIKADFEFEDFHQFAQKEGLTMKGPEIEKRLQKAQTRFLKELSIQDQQPQPLAVNQVAFLTIGRVKKAFQISVEKGKHVDSLVKVGGQLAASSRSITVQFPRSLGKVSLNITQVSAQTLSRSQPSQPIHLGSSQ